MEFSAPGKLLKDVLSFSNLPGAENCFTTRRSVGVDKVFFFTFFPLLLNNLSGADSYGDGGGGGGGGGWA
jgi:hypothetical protein